MERDSHEITSMVHQIFWKKTRVRRFTGSATSSSLEIPLPLQKQEYKAHKVFEPFSHSRKKCVCEYPCMVCCKKRRYSLRKMNGCKLKFATIEKANHLPNLYFWGSMLFLGAVYKIWGKLFIHFSASLQVAPRGVPTRRPCVQSLRGIVDLPATRLVHHQNAVQVLQIVEAFVLV